MKSYIVYSFRLASFSQDNYFEKVQLYGLATGVVPQDPVLKRA